MGPIRHRLEDAVRAHIFLCFLAYYVQWHMRRALAPVLFEDEQLDDLRHKRDPVAPAKSSKSAKAKKKKRLTPDGFHVHSFETLLPELAPRCKNKCTLRNASSQEEIYLITKPTPFQTHVFELLNLYPVNGS